MDNTHLERAQHGWTKKTGGMVCCHVGYIQNLTKDGLRQPNRWRRKIDTVLLTERRETI